MSCHVESFVIFFPQVLLQLCGAVDGLSNCRGTPAFPEAKVKVTEGGACLRDHKVRSSNFLRPATLYWTFVIIVCIYS
ncbi:hypothetical protein PHYPO_G00211180 [Pangasianodon hypophthalmus]|uniref:Secreted protein n=1 Tax=Pangasianodon hypophthalmus TaxID=310915 RepID=A0A5N5P5U8_PANHP|nr:hypothetical protein PHYPO_G00211180 [Pangasianodon hypophthalmus]